MRFGADVKPNGALPGNSPARRLGTATMRPASRATFALMTALALIFIDSGLARADEPGIWGEVIMKQPFDRQPFRADQDSDMGPGDRRMRLYAVGHGRQGTGRRRRARCHDQRDGLRRSVLSPTMTASS